MFPSVYFCGSEYMLSLGNQKGANKKETPDFLKGRVGKVIEYTGFEREEEMPGVEGLKEGWEVETRDGAGVGKVSTRCLQNSHKETCYLVK